MMKMTIGITAAWFLAAALTLPYSPTTLAAATATHKMAQIVMTLNHQPSEGDKDTLTRISNSGTKAEKTVAKALLDMDHRVSAADKEKLGKVAQDTSVPQTMRELATIVKNLDQKASSADKEKRRGM